LEKKLVRLSERQPPKRRNHIADVLEPLKERLLALAHNGWSSHALAGELTAAGVPVSPARLRECLSRWTEGGERVGKRRGRRRRQAAVLPTATLAGSAPIPPAAKKSGTPTTQTPFTLR